MDYKKDENDNILIGDFKFIITCGAAPEQYDVLDEHNNKIAYIRLRHGVLTCVVPDCFGLCVYDRDIEEYGDGWFDTEEYRKQHLIEIAEAIQSHYLEMSYEETRVVYLMRCEEVDRIVQKFKKELETQDGEKTI